MQSQRDETFFGAAPAMIPATGGHLPAPRRPHPAIAATLWMIFLGCGARSGLEVNADPRPEEPSCQPRVVWERRLPGLYPQALLPEGDGTLLLASGRQGHQTTLIALSADGGSRWELELPQHFSKLAHLGTGFVAAGSWGPSPDLRISAVSAEGRQLWQSDIAADREETATRVLVDANRIVIVGSSIPYPGSSGGDVIVAELDHDGQPGWLRRFGQSHAGLYPPDEHAFDAFLDPRGRAVIGSQRWLEGGGGPAWVFAVDPEGEQVWEYVSPVHYERGSVWVLLSTRDGGSLVTGNVPSAFGSGPARLVRLDDDGVPLWTASLDDGTTNQQVVSAGHETPSGELRLAGYSQSSTHARTWRVGASGSLIASRDYPEALGPFGMLRAMPNGGSLLSSTQTTYPERVGSWQLLRTRPDGTPHWRWELADDGYAMLGDLLVDARGRVLAAGTWSRDDEAEGRLVLIEEQCR
jgi:hypothetical protein